MDHPNVILYSFVENSTGQKRVINCFLSFQFVYDGKKPPAPFPTYKDKWDIAHVRMPCSNQSEYPVHTKVDYRV